MAEKGAHFNVKCLLTTEMYLQQDEKSHVWKSLLFHF